MWNGQNATVWKLIHLRTLNFWKLFIGPIIPSLIKEGVKFRFEPFVPKGAGVNVAIQNGGSMSNALATVRLLRMPSS